MMNHSTIFTFHNGPPPFPGWWYTSSGIDNEWRWWRWWDGESWSFGVSVGDDGIKAAETAMNKVYHTIAKCIKWCDYWPEDARCPRLNPGYSSTMWKGDVWAWIDGNLVNGKQFAPKHACKNNTELLEVGITLARHYTKEPDDVYAKLATLLEDLRYTVV